MAASLPGTRVSFAAGRRLGAAQRKRGTEDSTQQADPSGILASILLFFRVRHLVQFLPMMAGAPAWLTRNTTISA
jgi:hypothetical protein